MWSWHFQRLSCRHCCVQLSQNLVQNGQLSQILLFLDEIFFNPQQENEHINWTPLCPTTNSILASPFSPASEYRCPRGFAAPRAPLCYAFGAEDPAGSKTRMRAGKWYLPKNAVQGHYCKSGLVLMASNFAKSKERLMCSATGKVSNLQSIFVNRAERDNNHHVDRGDDSDLHSQWPVCRALCQGDYWLLWVLQEHCPWSGQEVQSRRVWGEGSTRKRKTPTARSDKTRTSSFLDKLEGRIEEDAALNISTLAQEFRVSYQCMWLAVHEDLCYKTYRFKICLLLTITMKEKRDRRAKSLIHKLKRGFPLRFFSHEKKFVVDQSTNRQNNRWLAKDPEDVPIHGDQTSKLCYGPGCDFQPWWCDSSPFLWCQGNYQKGGLPEGPLGEDCALDEWGEWWEAIRLPTEWCSSTHLKPCTKLARGEPSQPSLCLTQIVVAPLVTRL